METIEIKWQKQIGEARELRNKGIGLLHRRVFLLAECYEDPAFAGWCSDTGTDSIDYLNTEISDTGQDFLVMKAVLDAYPKESDWVAKGLMVMIAEILDSQKKTVRRESWKKRCLAAEAECERLRGELQKERQTVRELSDALESMRSESEMEHAMA